MTIIGAGIAGLTAALCLQKQGIECQIYEQRDHISKEGAGIQITPNSFRVLTQLGLGGMIAEKSHAAPALTLKNGRTGKIITQMPLGDRFTEKHGAPYLVLKRADLISSLFDQVQSLNIPVEFGSTARADDIKGPLVGADGVWSQTRRHLGANKARFSGSLAYRCTIRANPEEDFRQTHNLTISLRENAHLVYYPLYEGKELNIVLVCEGSSHENRWSTPVSHDEISQRLHGWSQSFTDLLVNRPANWRCWPLYVIDPAGRWVSDRLALIGDAAHAMLPFAAQGGSMAIEDAAVLAHHLANTHDTRSAFQAYQKTRQARVTRIWQEARSNGERYHWHGLKAHLRNLALKQIGGARLLERYNWIYEWHPPAL